VQVHPALLDRVFYAGAEFGTAALAAVCRHEWIIDLFDVNTAVDRFDAGGELDGLSSGRFRISVGTFVDQLHMGFRR
jgi:hypothetical protein